MWMFAQIAVLDFTPEERVRLLIWLAVLMVIVIAGFVGIRLFRRMLRDHGTSNKADTGFSLAALREMRDNGEITPEEYERARVKIVAKVKETLLPPEKDALPGVAIFYGKSGRSEPRP